MSSEQLSSPVWDSKHLRFAIDAAGVGLWSWNVDTDRVAMDERAVNMWGVEKNGPVTFEDLSSHIHPKDLDRVRADFAATRGVLGAYEIDFRILVGDEIRWIGARGRGNDEGIKGRNMFGIFLDVTNRKQAEEAHELLSGEMSHRVGNLLQVATALTHITSRSAATARDMARDLTDRLMALGRAHDLVRPGSGPAEKAALLGDLLAVLLAPYDNMEDFGGRVRISVPPMIVGEESATTLALVIHELATNSLRYGAMSAASGTLDVSRSVDESEVVLAWVERGGPAVVAPTGTTGFGSKMVNLGMSRQLGGSIAYDWSKEGLIVTLRLKKDRLAM
jgi:two-component sensor histidine kinase